MWRRDDEGLAGILVEVTAVVENPLRTVQVPLDPDGTPFQLGVWDAIRQIPVGTTITYSALATKIGNPRAVRAVAQACAHNALAIVIPCHRVVGVRGTLAGYRWGIERKRFLLAQEAKLVTAVPLGGVRTA
jgi:AraC family transcriptional regulator of adaptative response/methylated-DNA-[protein]-cysteine methyltransferase